jgi:hypothetical protein
MIHAFVALVHVIPDSKEKYQYFITLFKPLKFINTNNSQIKFKKTDNILACKNELIMKTGLNDFINNLNANKKTANVKEFIELVNNCALDIDVIKKKMSRINIMKIKQKLPLF